MRGETDFSLEETALLCRHFDVPLESLNTEMHNVVSFYINPLTEQAESFGDYLSQLRAELQWMIPFEHKRLSYAAEDLPVFYHLYFPHLAKFKIVYWTKSIMNTGNVLGKKLEEIEPDDSWTADADNIGALYQQIPSLEVWNEDTVKSTLQQIRFYWEAGLFAEKETALKVVDQLTSLLHMVQKQAETGRKYNPYTGASLAGAFDFYISDLMIGNNCVMMSANQKTATFIGYNTFNFMRTTNRFFNEQTARWFDNLLSKSNPASKVGEKMRNQFFKNGQQQIEALRRSIIRD
jgi:hypothetical protein